MPAAQTVIIREKRGGCGCVFIALLAIATAVVWALYCIGKKEDRKIEKSIEFDCARRGVEYKPLDPDVENSAPIDAWTTGHQRDDLTDEDFYYIYCDGLQIEEDFLDYTPRLFLKLSRPPRAADTLQSADCLIVIETDAIRRDGCAAVVRIDAKPPEQVMLTPGQNRSSLFLPAGFAKRLDGARTLIVRFETSLGAVRTLRFNLGGVSHHALVQKMRREISTR